MKARDQEQWNRRHFLRQSACATLGYTGLVSALTNMRLLTAASANHHEGSHFKAVVNLFLFGGNDSNNMLVPFSGEHRADYDQHRGILALPKNDLKRIYPTNHADGWGVHPEMQGVADLFNNNKLSFVANVGSLAYPVADRTEYNSGSAKLPPQLYSHSDQQLQWQTSLPDRPYTTGWGGRVADMLNSAYNANSEVSMSISLAGINSYQVGGPGGVVQYAVDRTGGATSLWGYGPSTNRYQNALNEDGSYKTNWPGQRLKAFEEIMNYSSSSLMENSYNKVVQRARDFEGTVGAAISSADASAVDFDAIFANADTRLGDQLKMIAKLIAGRAPLGNDRQVYFASQGGYDTHQTQLPSHANLMRELSDALAAFQAAIDAMGMTNDVLLFSSSDFTRTFTPNGTDPNNAGSDHGWGGHHIVMGGPVDGKKIFGNFPLLEPAKQDDSNGSRGRWIPSTSVDQYGSVIARWFGVDSNSLDTIFPNLGRFDDPTTVDSANLKFIPSILS